MASLSQFQRENVNVEDQSTIQRKKKSNKRSLSKTPKISKRVSFRELSEY